VSQHDDDSFAQGTEQLQSACDQPGSGIDPHSGKEDMANNGRFQLGHEGDQHASVISQPVDEAGFVDAAEGSLIHCPNGIEFSGAL